MNPTPFGSVSLADLLTAAKNIASAINNAAQTFINVSGAQTLAQISTLTLVQSKAARVARVSVTTAGSTTGLIYDCNSTTSLVRPIYVIPNTAGVYEVNLPTNYGIVVSPGTGQVLTVSFSQNPNAT